MRLQLAPAFSNRAPAEAQAWLQGCRAAGAATDRRRIDLEFRPQWGTAHLAQPDTDETAAHLVALKSCGEILTSIKPLPDLQKESTLEGST
jgi:hypothetical protein